MAIRNTNTKENEPVLENGKKKSKEDRPATKVVVRRLPPTMSEEQFKLQISPLPEIDYFYFVSADMSLAPNAFSRAYINFVDQSDLFIFTQKFDGYVFIDSKGGEFPAIVEFAPFQRIPKNRPNRKKDPKVGTIEADPMYIAFQEQLEADNMENRTAANASKQHFFETSLIPEKKELNNTPLLDFIKNKRAERQRIRDEKREEKRKKDLERRRAKEELRRTKKDDDPSVVKTFLSNPEIPKLDTFTIPNLQSKQNYENMRLSTVNCNKNASKKDHNNSIGEEKVKNNVNDFVRLFNNSNNKPLIRNRTKLNIYQNFVTHSSIEKELHMTTNKPESILHYKKSSCFPKKYFNTPLPPPVFNECNNLFSCHQLRKTYQTKCVPKSTELVVPNQIVKEAKLQKRCITSNELTVKMNDIQEEQTSTLFYEHAFKKNLQKIVKDVLGSTDVKISTGSKINKPNIFVQRGGIGSGEQCTRPGFNSPLFYLPPRAYGCGQSQVTNTSPKALKDNTMQNQVQSTSSSQLIEKGFAGDGCETFLKNPLPISTPYLSPFSKKFISLSKSDDNIELSENSIKIGGSHENLKSQIEPLVLGMKAHLRRPNVMPRRAINTDKDY